MNQEYLQQWWAGLTKPDRALVVRTIESKSKHPLAGPEWAASATSIVEAFRINPDHAPTPDQLYMLRKVAK